MKSRIIHVTLSILSLGALNSCAMPGVVANNNYPQSVTETHTKTTIVSPPSYSNVSMPQAAFYQSQSMTQPLQSDLCQPQAYASPVHQKTNLNYQPVATAQAPVQYIVVQPMPVQSSQALKVPVCVDSNTQVSE